ncbi:MAG: hypothetical protein FWC24_03320 [Treponema sp.]|nr:hypothetical protein [Treponema sp.]
MAGVAYVAISRKSSFKIRIAALGALALMILTVIICIILFLTTDNSVQPLILPDMEPSEMPPPPPENNNAMTLIMFMVFLIGLFVMILLLSLREQKRA